jgi:putative nucleotidyltransferase with HDIG domain
LAAATLEALLNAVDANDEVTGRHMRRTATYALCLADALGLSEVERRKVERVALFHDIGKIHAALFDIVHDDKKLTPAERARVATHPQRGAEVLAPLEAFYPELPAGVLAHHERWDGTGYPHRLVGESIPFFARIIAIADSFDAITHSRRYHAGEGPQRGLRAIAEGRGTQFDPQLVDLFLSGPVQANVRRTFEQSDVAVVQPASKPRRVERRAVDEPESSVPDVRFRWRTSPETATVQHSRNATATGSTGS